MQELQQTTSVMVSGGRRYQAIANPEAFNPSPDLYVLESTEIWRGEVTLHFVLRSKRAKG